MNLEEMQNYIYKIFAGFGAQPVLVGLRATEDTIAGAVGLRLDLNIDNSLFQLRSPVIGMIFVNENYLKSFPDVEVYFILAHECAHILKSHVLSKAFWTLLETIANGPKNENRAVAESIKLALALGLSSWIGTRRAREDWAIWYLVRPPVGTALAVITYLVIRAGLIQGAGINDFGVGAISVSR
jgi:hypothetical protein